MVDVLQPALFPGDDQSLPGVPFGTRELPKLQLGLTQGAEYVAAILGARFVLQTSQDFEQGPFRRFRVPLHHFRFGVGGQNLHLQVGHPMGGDPFAGRLTVRKRFVDLSHRQLGIREIDEAHGSKVVVVQRAVGGQATFEILGCRCLIAQLLVDKGDLLLGVGRPCFQPRIAGCRVRLDRIIDGPVGTAELPLHGGR